MSESIFLSVYQKLTEAISLILRDGQVKNPAKALFWQARDEARLQLPEEIQNYTQRLFDEMWEAYLLYYQKLTGEERLTKGPERSQASARHTELIGKLIKERPFEIFQKYLKVNYSSNSDLKNFKGLLV